MNLHQKMLKIAETAGILQRTKAGYNYKYVPEEEIQAKVTGAMQEYGVMLYNQIVPGTTSITPRQYTRTKMVKGVEKITEVNEVIVSADTVYTWVNTDNPEEKIDIPWVIIGQMEDASQAFGAATTYCNRYFLMKSLQLATTEADPDDYRSKQQESRDYEKNKAEQEAQETLQQAIKGVVDAGSKLMALGVTRDDIYKAVSAHNGGEKDPSSIKDAKICELIIEDFAKLEKNMVKEPKNKKTDRQKKNEETDGEVK